MKNKIIFVMFLILMPAVFLKAQSLVLKPSADSWLRYSLACPSWQTLNGGTSTSLNVVGEWTYNAVNCARGTYRSLLLFPLPQYYNSHCLYDNRASLELFFPTGNSQTHSYLSPATGNPFYIQQVINPWTELGVTWDNQPASSSVGQLLIPSTVLNPSTQNFQIDVSGLVYGWVCNNVPNYGFLFKMLNEGTLYNRVTFASREFNDTTKNPKLILEYACITASAPDTLCIGSNFSISCNLTNAFNPSVYQYKWTHLNTGINYNTQNVINPANNLGRNTYVVNVTNSWCESATDTVEVYIADTPSVNIGKDTTICTGNTLTLDAKNIGMTYKWSTGVSTQSIIATSTGSYAVTVSNGFCTDRDTINITFNTQPNVNLGKDTILCAGTSLTIDAKNSGMTYKWSTGVITQSIIVTSTGSYAVTVSNGPCTDRDTILVTFNTQPNVSLGKDTILCTGSSLSLDAKNSGMTYKWSTGVATQNIIVTTTGLYAVTVSNGPCTDRDTINVIFGTVPLVDLGGDTTICDENSLTLNAGNPGKSYNWSTGETTQTISANSSGIYAVTVSDNGCTGRDTININLGVIPIVFLGNDTVLCQGMNLILDAANSGSNYKWSTGATAQTISVSSSGKYSVSVSKNGCTASDLIDIGFMSPPLVDLGKDTSLCAANSFVLNAGNSGCTYNWSTGSVSQAITITTSGTYSVSVSCAVCPPVSDDISIAFTSQFSSLYFPNTFTPDKNGINDIFKGSGEGIVFYNLKIFNRWGEMIFETSDLGDGWDGKHKDVLEKYDVYVWVADYSYSCAPKKKLRKYGNVLLLK